MCELEKGNVQKRIEEKENVGEKTLRSILNNIKENLTIAKLTFEDGTVEGKATIADHKRAKYSEDFKVKLDISFPLEFSQIAKTIPNQRTLTIFIDSKSCGGKDKNGEPYSTNIPSRIWYNKNIYINKKGLNKDDTLILDFQNYIDNVVYRDMILIYRDMTFNKIYLWLQCKTVKDSVKSQPFFEWEGDKQGFENERRNYINQNQYEELEDADKCNWKMKVLISKFGADKVFSSDLELERYLYAIFYKTAKNKLNAIIEPFMLSGKFMDTIVCVEPSKYGKVGDITPFVYFKGDKFEVPTGGAVITLNIANTSFLGGVANV